MYFLFYIIPEKSKLNHICSNRHRTSRASSEQRLQWGRFRGDCAAYRGEERGQPRRRLLGGTGPCYGAERLRYHPTAQTTVLVVLGRHAAVAGNCCLARQLEQVVLEGRKPIFCCLTIDYMAGVDFLLYFVKLSFLLSSHFSVFLLV